MKPFLDESVFYFSKMTHKHREEHHRKRTPSTGSKMPEHKTEDYDSGKPDLMPQLHTVLCRQISSTRCFLREENELYSRDSPRLDHHRRL